MRLLVVLAVACCLAGCGGTGKRADALAPVPDDVKRAYLAYWDAWLAANETDAVDDPALDRVAENPNLEVLRAALRAAADRHQVTKGTVRHEIRGMSVEGEAHKVVDCVDIDGWLLYDKATGERIADQLVDRPRQLMVVTFHRRAGAWKATDGHVLGQC